ncbi:MAG: hypothetical protein A2W22_03410 [Candidatus Levybacteria bacterium RBG_16_35_11]|nr:MAG: hypothetical protein A2W22_03410 [Candidatus Levybacteria bacterium RBG_16_35_11]
MNKKLKCVFYLAFATTIFLTFKAWFLPGLITAGDLWPNFASMYPNRPISLYAWDYGNAAGLGGVVSPILWIYLNFGIASTVLGKLFNLSWSIVERVYFLYPIIILSLFSSFYLFKKLFNNSNFAILSSFIFTLNTYLLMVVGGGQVSIALSYVISPLVFYFFLKTFNFAKNDKLNLKNILFSSLIFSFQFQLDIRIAYVTLIAILIYWVLKIILNNSFTYFLRSFLFGIIVPGILTALIHFYWILPTFLTGKNPIQQMGDIYSSSDAVKFFSFAKFEDTMGLLHPNWPENIFGKVYFMRPEFLLLPILAYASLIFFPKIKDLRLKTYLLYFACLGIIGAFLAKGANAPFGNIYLWLFNYFPGMQMFRDPTKWYLLVALSYSMLIPFTIWKIYDFLKSHKALVKSKFFNPSSIFLILTFLYLLFLIRPALIGQLGGTFKVRKVPKDYVKLEKFLSQDIDYGRVLWIPATQRFSYFSSNHPAMPGYDYFKTTDPTSTARKLGVKNMEQILKESAVKYIIVPNDSEGEIFLDDRKYSEREYLKTVTTVKKTPFLKEIEGFGKIKVFKVPNPKDHFWLTGGGEVAYKFVSPVEYRVSLEDVKNGELLIFSENYNNNWVAMDLRYKNQPSTIKSQKHNLFNSFKVQRDGSYDFIIYYQPQKWVNIGIIVSLLSLASVLGLSIKIVK